MKAVRRTRAVVLAFSILAVAGCKNTQPDHVDSRTASLTITAKAKMENLNCYEIWQDTSNPLDGVPDVFLDQTQCDELPPAPIFNQKNVPWNYSLLVTVIHAGTANEQLVTSLSGVPGASIGGLGDFISMTDYDADVPPAPFKLPQGDIHFLNGKKVSRGSPVYLASFALTCPACPVDLGVANMLGGANSFDFTVNSGDTVVVRARKRSVDGSPPFLPQVPDPEIRLSAVLKIGGVEVATSGIKESATTDGAGFSFSFTVQ